MMLMIDKLTTWAGLHGIPFVDSDQRDSARCCHFPEFLCKSRSMTPAFWFDRLGFESELVRVQYLHHITEIGDARIIVEKLRCDLIRNLHGHIPIGGEHLELYIREAVANGGASRRAHIATAFTASFHHRITGSPGFVDDSGDLFQQQLFRDDNELGGLLSHVYYLLKLVVIELCGRVSCPRDVDAGEEVIGPDLWAARLLNGDDADLDIAAALVAGQGSTGRPQPHLGSAAHQSLGERDVERYSQGNRNRRADGCGRADVGGGIGRRDTSS